MVTIENCLILKNQLGIDHFEIFLIIKLCQIEKSGLNIRIQAGLDAGHGVTVGVE